MDILETNREYTCFCGKDAAFEFAASYILEHSTVSDISSLKVAVISDRLVSGYHYNRFENQFIDRGVKPVLIPVECVNNGKSLSAVEQIFKFITDFDFGVDDWIIGLGGGGILDASGFAAKVFNGGINYLAIPTTLNAMADGSLATKAYLNSMSHKDEISVSFEPDAVIIDPSFLSTVPPKVRSNGYASIIRYGILDDLSLILELEKDMPGNIREFLNRVYSSRARIEKTDPRLLTLGSEISGAIEGYFRFMNYSEGEALALSLLSAVDGRRREPLSKIYGVLGLPVKLKDVSSKMIMKTLTDRINRKYSEHFPIVDFVDSGSGMWTVRDVTREEAIGIFSRRIAVIGE